MQVTNRGSNFNFSSILRGAASTFILKVAAAGFLFLFNLLISRTYGAEGSGLYFLAITVVNVAVTISRLGLENTVTRAVAIAHSNNDYFAIRSIYKGAISATLLLALVITSLIIILSGELSNYVFSKPQLASILSVMALAIPPTALYYLHAHILKGLHKPVSAMAIMSFFAPLLAIGIFWASSRERGIITAVIAYDLAAFITFILAYLVWANATPSPSNVSTSNEPYPLRKLLRSSMPMFTGSLLSLVTLWLPMFVLGIYSSTSEVGLFGAANRAAALLNFLLIAINTVFGSRFAVMFERGQRNEIEKLARIISMVGFFAVAPVVLLFAVAGNFVMGLFGPEFAGSGLILTIMAFGQLINVTTGPVGLILSMTGYEWVVRNILFATALLSAILCLLLIPLWGGLGAAIAVAITLSVQNLAAFVSVKKLIFTEK